MLCAGYSMPRYTEADLPAHAARSALVNFIFSITGMTVSPVSILSALIFRLTIIPLEQCNCVCGDQCALG